MPSATRPKSNSKPPGQPWFLLGATTSPWPTAPEPPPPFELEPVLEFSWAGTGNGGVRPWIDDHGEDYLTVLRHSGAVPAALVEFVDITNPAEETFFADPAFTKIEATSLAGAIIAHFSQNDGGSGFVATQIGDQDIGGQSGRCSPPPSGFDTVDGVSYTRGFHPDTLQAG